MIKIARDYFDNPIVPDYVLCKANKERIGIIQCTGKTKDIKYNDLNEISFKTYLYIDNEKNPYYEAIDIMKYILLPDIGFFCISDCKIQSEGTEFEYKEVTAKSYECLLAQKYIDTFSINTGNIESIDGVQFYNIGDKEHSLLHIALLNQCPDWKIGHVDTSLITMQRSFEVDRQDIYSFLMNDVSTAFECIFVFDTLTNTVNIYKEENYGEDTNIHISYNNLLKNTNISCSLDDIKTCLTITGADDLNIREINMGYDKIYNFSPYNSTEYMSEGLYIAYNKWVELRKKNLDTYTSLLSQYQNYYSKINELTNLKMPDNPESTDWTLYGLVPLKEKLSTYEQKQAVSMKAGHGEPDSKFYESEYLPIYNTITDINKQIEVVTTQLETLKNKQSKIFNQMTTIINLVSMENNFAEDELKELSTFIREDELNSDNFIVTDIMTDEERFEMLNQMLEFGEKELAKACTPQLSFSASVANIFSIPEFDKICEQFDIANYIWITLRDDYNIKARLLTIHINYEDSSDFSISFGNIARKAKTRYTDVSEMIKASASAATSVSFNSSYWSQAAKDTSDIGKMLDDGLLSAGKYLTNGDDSEMVIDKRGIFVNTRSGDYADKDSIFIGGGRVLFTDDNWKSVAMAVGRAAVNGESRFGVFADFCIASYIAGSTMEGGTITGTIFNNGNGTFKVDENGHMIAKSGEFQGKVTASEISGSSINNGNGTFSVDTNGKLTASDAYITKGEIGGAKITNSSIKASNDKWKINSDGSASFTDLFVSGVRVGSNFGGINIGNNGWTSGNFGNGITADTSFGVTGGALQNFNDLVANKVTASYIEATAQLSAKYATIGSLEAVSARVGTIESDYTTTGELNAQIARINTIESNYISSSTVYADFMEVTNWTSSGYIKASKINTDELTVKKIYLSDSGNIATVASAKGYIFTSAPSITVKKDPNTGYVTSVTFNGSYGNAEILTRLNTA